MLISTRPRAHLFAWGAILIFATGGCTTTYGPDNLPKEDELRQPICDEMGLDEGCAQDNPICTDPSDYECTGPAG